MHAVAVANARDVPWRRGAGIPEQESQGLWGVTRIQLRT